MPLESNYVAALPTYSDFLDLVVGGVSTPQDILNYHLPEDDQRRIEDLMAKSKEEDLTEEEALVNMERPILRRSAGYAAKS